MDERTSFDQMVLRSHSNLVINRSWLDGQARYVMRNDSQGRLHALAVREYGIFSKFDGRLTCGEVFDTLTSEGALQASDIDSYRALVIGFIDRSLLIVDSEQKRNTIPTPAQSILSSVSGKLDRLLFRKLSLGSPNGLLTFLSKWLGWLFTWPAAVTAGICVLMAASIFYFRWKVEARILVDLYSEQNLLLLIAIFCITKLWHEIGHGIACRKYGCPVRDWGIYFIAGTPCAYIDASSSWSLPSRVQRIVVCLAGIYFEILLAIPAIAVWAFSESPRLKEWALHIVVLSTVTTVLFNANPLMKFDGYFVLCDLLGMPNLRSRAKALVGWILKRHLFGVQFPPPENGFIKSMFFLCFGILTEIYTWTIVTGIFLVLMWRIPVVGIAIAFTYGCTTLIKTLNVHCSFLLRSREMEAKRFRGVALTAIAFSAISIFYFIPIPRNVYLEGFTAYAEETLIRSTSRGIVLFEAIEPGQPLCENHLLATLIAPSITDQVRQSDSRLRELEILRNAAIGRDRTRLLALNTETRIASAQQTLAHQRAECLEIRLPKPGYFLTWEGTVKNGEQIEDGAIIAKVGIGDVILKVVCNQRQLAEFTPRIGERVTASFPWDLQKTYDAEIIRISQCAASSLESPVLSAASGGQIAVNPGTLKPVDDHVMIEIAIQSPPSHAYRTGVRGELQLHRRCSSLANWARYRWLSFYRGFLKEQA